MISALAQSTSMLRVFLALNPELEVVREQIERNEDAMENEMTASEALALSDLCAPDPRFREDRAGIERYSNQGVN